MLHNNQEYTVDIIDIEPLAGRGVAKYENFVIFVPFAITGERVKIEIIHIKKSHAIGKLIEIITPSKFRISPLCEFYYSCGGCNYQHIDYSYQLQIKSISLTNNIKKISGLNINTIEVLPSPSKFFYRNRIKYTIKNNRFGFLNNDYTFTPITSCVIADKKINKLVSSIDKQKTHKFSHIHLRIDNQNHNVIFLKKGKTTEFVSDNKELEFNVCGYSFKVLAESFFQVNTTILSLMKESIEKQLLPKKSEILLDLFCGAGFFSILLAGEYKNIYGLEIDKKAILKAKENSKINNINNAFFIAGSVEKNIKKLLEKNKDKKVSAIIDPPRAGLDKNTISYILKSNVNKILYVSCYPPTFARDLKMLTEIFEIKSIKGLDMFPQTSHTEIICLLERKSS